ncbi:hypothetical protein JST97_02740 [bacterium]|nr:hypothetical protein [bacterium]
MDSYFYRTSLRRIYNCTEPAIPEGTPFSWVFYAAELAIIEIPADADVPHCPGLERIEGKLEALLASSHKYPPARALAAEALEESQLEWPALAARMERLLTHYFKGQAASGFRLLKCLEDQGDSLEMGGYGGVGHYYWVLASDGEKLTWVSDHLYGVHRAPIAEFEVPEGCRLPACVAPVPD